MTTELLSPGDAASELGVDRSTVIAWIDRGIARPLGRMPSGTYVLQREEVERLRGIRGDRKQMPREAS